MQPRVSIVIPVFNEAATVGEAVRRVLGVTLPVEREIIVVDDGSTDDTPRDLEDVRRSFPEVRVLRHATNRGKGAALRTGFLAAEGDVVLIQDGDMEYDPTCYPELLEPILDGDADVVYGSRFARGGRPSGYLLFWLGNRVITGVANALTGLNLTDVETCYKVFRRSILSELSFVSDDFAFEVEFTVKVARRGLRIREVPIAYRPRSFAQGKKIKWTDGFLALAALLRFRFLA